jgi:hypothetical protein
MDLKVDNKRYENLIDPINNTGIWVRALRNDKWESVDIVFLDKDSLLSWLKSRGGDNRYAEDCVGILLGHGHLHDYTLTGE